MYWTWLLLPSGAVKRVLITGADGFVGRYLRSALDDRGIESIALAADIRDGKAVAGGRCDRGGRCSRAPRRHRLGGGCMEPRA